MAKNDIVIIAPFRTAIGKFGGMLKDKSAAELGGDVSKMVIEKSNVPKAQIGLAIFGHARQAGGGPNTARQIVKRSGLSDDVPALTVNQACASGLRAVVLAAQAIRDGEASVVLAGGTESMSNTPYLLPRARWGYKFGNAEVVDGMYRDGFICPLCGMVMGETAEKLVEQKQISREAQDEFAVESQKRWKAALDSGRWDREIVCYEKDEHPRPDTTMETLAKLKPVFKEGGSVHPGNTSGITDGAAACLVMTEQTAKELGCEPMVVLRDYATVGVDPSIMGIGPVPAVRKLMKKSDVSLSDIDLIELNEAFAGQALACIQDLELDRAKVNVSGGAIALGHPIGCTGARILTTLIHDLVANDKQRGVATLCVSGGMGMAVLVERR